MGSESRKSKIESVLWKYDIREIESRKSRIESVLGKRDIKGAKVENQECVRENFDKFKFFLAFKKQKQ